MTVKELIEKLAALNPNLDVIYEDYDPTTGSFEKIQRHISEPSMGVTNSTGTYREVVVIGSE